MPNIFAIIFILFSTNAFSNFFDEKMKIRLTTHNLCPYGCYQMGEFKGIAVDRVKCALQKLKTPFQIDILPWKRAQYLVKENKADAFFAASAKKGRNTFAQKSDKVAEQIWQWVFLKNSKLNPKDKRFKKQARVASFIGANMLDWLLENKYNVTSKPKNSEDLLKMLMSKRVDAILINNLVLDKLILKEEFKFLSLNRIDVKNKPLFVYFNKAFLKKHPQFLNGFNKYLSLCY